MPTSLLIIALISLPDQWLCGRITTAWASARAPLHHRRSLAVDLSPSLYLFLCPLPRVHDSYPFPCPCCRRTRHVYLCRRPTEGATAVRPQCSRPRQWPRRRRQWRWVTASGLWGCRGPMRWGGSGGSTASTSPSHWPRSPPSSR